MHGLKRRTKGVVFRAEEAQSLKDLGNGRTLLEKRHILGGAVPSMGVGWLLKDKLIAGSEEMSKALKARAEKVHLSR